MLNKLYSWILRSYGNRNNAKCHRLPESSLLQMLEPRLMFDGAAVETVDIADGVSQIEQNYILKSLDENNQAKITESLLKAIQKDAEHVQTDYSQFKEVVIIDANVKDPHILLESISRDAAVEIILPNQNGVDAIADILQKYQNLDAVHIISHGEQAELSLGNIIFNSNNIGSYQLQLAQWGSALTEHGDILFYGCNVAEGEAGRNFINTLNQYTEADIAASVDMTGKNDGDLEYHQGPIDVDEIVSFEAYQETLDNFDNLVLENQIIAADGDQDDEFGRSVAISEDGTTMVVGAPFNDDQGQDSGLIYIYRWDGTDWQADGQITTSYGNSHEGFGNVVSISADGNTVMTSATVDLGFITLGMAFIYEFDGSDWEETPLDFFDDDPDLLAMPSYGDSVAISADGEIAVVGSPDTEYADPGGGTISRGEVHLFTKNGSQWEWIGRRFSDSESSSYGTSVSIAQSGTLSDGDFLLVGDPFEEVNGQFLGAVYIYQRVSQDWIEQQTLTAPDVLPLSFFGGIPASISSDGDTIVVSALYDGNNINDDYGSVYVYEWSSSQSQWSLSQKLTADNPNNSDTFGSSTYISPDGDTIIIGERGNESAYIYQKDGSTWTEERQLTVPGGQSGWFGFSLSASVGLSSKVMVAAPQHDDNRGDKVGAVYFYYFSTAPTAADNTITIDEDEVYVFEASDFNYTDAQNDQFASVLVTNSVSTGTLQYRGNNVTNNTVVMRADIDAGRLVFIPDANENGTGYASFDFRVNDQIDASMLDPGLTVLDYEALNYSIDSYTMTMDVTAINDRPTALSSVVFTQKNTDYIFSTSDFNFSDDDGDELASIKITALPTVGNLKLSGSNVVLNQVISKTALDSGALVFSPLLDEVGISYDNFSFSVNDGTEDSVLDYIITIDVQSLNAPTAADSVVTASEDTDYIFSASDFSFSDIDGDNLASIKVTALESIGSLKLNGVDIVLNQEISRANIDSGLLTFTPEANVHGTGYDSFRFRVSDGTQDSLSDYAMTIDVDPVNDAPVNNIPSEVNINEDTTFVFDAGTGVIRIIDVDGSAIQVSLSVSNGQLNLSELTGITIDSGANNSSAIVFSGAIADVNAALYRLSYTPNIGFVGQDSLTIVSNDLGNSGTGGALSDSDSITLNVDAVPAVSIVEMVNDDGGTEDKNYVTLLIRNNATIETGTQLVININDSTPSGTVVASFNGSNWVAQNGASINTTQSVTGSDYSTLVIEDSGDWLKHTEATGIALITSDRVLEFISYEGNVNYVHNGNTYLSVDIGVTSNNESRSLKKYANGDWQINKNDFYTARGALPAGFGGAEVALADPINADAFISMMQYDGASGGPDNFISIVVRDGVDFDGYQLARYTSNNDNGTVYLENVAGVWTSSATLSQQSYPEHGYTVISIELGLSNDPRATALLDATGKPIDFISYEGDFTIDFNGTTYRSVGIGLQFNENYAFLRNKDSLFTPMFDITPNSGGDVTEDYATYLPLDLIYPQAETEYLTSNLLINRVLYDDGGTDDVEYIELFYRTGGVETGTQLIININPDVYTEEVALTSGSWLVESGYSVTTPDNSGIFNSVALKMEGSSFIGNQPRGIALVDAAGNPIEFISTEGPITRDFNGVTYVSKNLEVYQEDDSEGVLKRQSDDTWVRYYESDRVSSAGQLEDGIFPQPFADDNTIVTDEDTPYVFNSADFNYSDLDNNPLVSIKITTLPTAGQLRLGGSNVIVNQVIDVADINAGDLVFSPGANENGVGYDSFGFSVNDGVYDSLSSYTITIDVTPVNDAPTALDSTVTVKQDTDYVFKTVDFNFSDVDGDLLASIKVTALESVGGLKLNGSDVVLNQVITRADIEAGLLTFTPLAGQIGQAYDNFSFTVNDGSVDSAISYAMTIDVVTPSIPTAANSTVSTNEDSDYSFKVEDFNFSDVDGDLLVSIKVTALESVGNLKLNGSDVVVNQVINRADIEAGLFSFSPQLNQNGVGYDSFGFSVNDGSSDSASSYVMTIDVVAINDAPVNTVPGAQSVDEDTPLAISGLSVNDVEGLASTQLSVANGTLRVTLAGSAAISAGANNTNTLTISGSQSDINGTLASLMYQGNLNFHGADVLNVVSTDNGTSALTDIDTVAITVNSVNEKPIHNIPAPQTVDEDAPLAIAGISVNDVDGNLVSTKIRVGNGTLSVVLSGSASISAGANNSKDVTISGSQSDINGTLASLIYQGNLNFHGADVLNIISTDSDGEVTTGTLAMTVNSVNDAPENTVLGPQTVYANTALPLPGIVVSDVDGNLASTRLSVLNGTLSVVLSGSAAISGGVNNSSTLTISGSESDINATLASLTYQGNLNFNGNDVLTVTSTDSDVLPLSAVDTVSITVGSPPINTVPGAQVVAEDTDLNITGISAYDFDGNLASTRLSVVNGTLGVTLSGNAIISAGANNSNSVTISGNEIDINATLASLVYRGSLHFNGADVLNIVSTDSVTLFTDTDTVAITVTPVNDAPVLASGNVLNYTESDSATIIDAGITVSDIDSSNIESASISIDSNYVTGEDVLQFTAIGNITGNFNSETGVLTLSGTDTVANYQAALRSVSYANTSDSPSINPRVINFVVNDGALNSAIASSTVNITAIEEAPFIPESAAGFDDLEDGPLNALDLESEQDLDLSASLDFDDLIDQEDERLTNKVFFPEINNVLSGNGTKSNPFVFEISSNKPIMLGSVLRNVGKIEMPTEGLNENMGALDIVTVDNKLQIYFVPETAFSGDENFSLQVYKNGILSTTVYFEMKFSEALNDEDTEAMTESASVVTELSADEIATESPKETDKIPSQNEEKTSLLSKLKAAFTGEAEFQGDANTDSDALKQRDQLESTKKNILDQFGKAS